MERERTTRRGVLTAAGGALVALAGCSNTDGQGGTPTPTDDGGMEPMDTDTATEEPTETAPEETETGTPAAGDAMLRVAHLSPDAPNVDVAVDGTTALEDVAFETVSDYLALSAGDHQVTVTPTGGDEPVFDETVTLESGLQTAAAIGQVSGGDQPFTVTLLTDDDMLADAGTTRVRAVHAIPDAPAVDVTAGDAVVADNIAFGEAGEYVSAPADTSTVELRPESPGNDEAPVGTFDVSLTDQAVQTIFATGYLEPTGDQPGATLVAATDAAPEGMTGATGTPSGTGSPTETGTGTGVL